MALLLRTVRHSRWLSDSAKPYLAKHDLPADPFADLSTSDNVLSVWEVAEDRTNVERIVRAIAVGRDKIDHVAYILFDSQLVEASKIEIQITKGKTHDDGANDWHRDLVLTGRKLYALVDGMIRSGQLERVLQKRLIQLVEEGIESGELPDKLLEKLKRSK